MEEIEQLVRLLKDATSIEFSNTATKTLEESEKKKGYHLCLLTIALNKQPNVESNIRLLAAVCLKNGIEKHWRTHGPSPITNDEKTAIKNEILSCFDEIEPQIALQFAVIIAKIARYDSKWPQLFDILISSITSLEPCRMELRDNTVLLTHRYVMKELGSKRLPNDRKIFEEHLSRNWPCCVTVWERFHQTTVEAFRLGNWKYPEMLFLVEKLINILKGLRCMSPMLTIDKKQMLLKSVIHGLQIHLSFSQTITPNSSKLYETFQKLLILHTKILLDSFDYTENVIQGFSKDIVELCKQCILLHSQNTQVLSERFIVNCLNLIKAIASKNNNDVDISDDGMKELLRCLVFSYLPLTISDLENWENDAEEFCAEEIGETWKYNLRPSAEALFLTFLHEYSERLVPLVVSTIQSLNETIQKMIRKTMEQCWRFYYCFCVISSCSGTNDLQTTVDPSSIIMTDAVLTTAGLACNQLFDQFDFEEWFQNYLSPYLQKCFGHSHCKIIHRRLLWLIETWMEVKPLSNIKTLVYEFVILSMSNNFDMAVRLSASSALRQVMDDFELDLDTFAPHQENCTDALYLLLQDAESGDSKMRVLFVLSCVIERLGPRVISCAHKLAEILPFIWQTSESHNMLRCAVVSTLINVVVGLRGQWSPTLANFLFDVIYVCTDVTSHASVYLVEDGLGLWNALLQNTENISEILLQLFNNIYGLLEISSDLLKDCLEIVKCYGVLGGEGFFVGEHGRRLARAISSLITDVKDECLIIVARLIETFTRVAPKNCVSVFDKYIFDTIGFVLANEDGTPLAAARVVLVARVAFQNPSAFWELLSKVSGDRREDGISQFFHVIEEKIDSIVEGGQKKIVALACLSLLMYFNESKAVQISVSRIMNVCLQVLYDVCDDDGVDTVMFTHNASDQTADEECDNFHSLRMRRLVHFDESLKTSLPDFVRNKLDHLAHCCGGQDQLQTFLNGTVDVAVLQGLSQFLYR